MQGGLEPAESRLRAVLVGHAILSAVLAAGYLVDAETAVVWALPNSFAKDVLFAALSVLGAVDVRRRGWMALVIAAGYVALIVGEAFTLAVGGAADPSLPLVGEVPATTFLIAWMGIDAALAALFWVLWVSAARAGHGLKYLHPVAFHGLAALAEVLVEGRREALSPEQVALNVDRYLHGLQARDKGRVQLALVVLTLLPLLTLRPPLPALAPDARKRFLEQRFLGDLAERRLLRPLRPYVQILIRTASQMSYLGYYGDERSWQSIGYTPFRKRRDGRPPRPDDQRKPALRTLPVPDKPASYDIAVVGSGAAGAILAHRFAEQGRSVLVLERGPHGDARRFTHDEVRQYLRLYNEGALQLTTRFDLQVLQGMCVGGGTTINNALCLDPPEQVLDEWARHGVDRDALLRAVGDVRTWLQVKEIPARNATEAAKRFAKAVQELELPGELRVMSVNLSDACLGTGYCNIGCAYGARLAAQDFVLPHAQHDLPGSVDVLPDVMVERVLLDGPRAAGVAGTHGSGTEVTVRADKVVIAAGAIASSWLLQRNRLGGDRVGEGLHFNINSPLTADFDDVVDAFDGIQMSHVYIPRPGIPGYLVETWFNPPATQALAMPGWFDIHFDNMRRYRHMASAGVLVGTANPGRVKPTKGGPAIEYESSAGDRARVLEGLRVAGRIWLKAGATRVMPSTFRYQEYTTPASLDRLPERVRRPGDLLLSSAHPQGGNALGAVVDQDFRVRGADNLYLCDASVFPTSVQVNPQLTVMAMAHYAAERILA